MLERKVWLDELVQFYCCFERLFSQSIRNNVQFFHQSQLVPWTLIILVAGHPDELDLELAFRHEVLQVPQDVGLPLLVRKTLGASVAVSENASVVAVDKYFGVEGRRARCRGAQDELNGNRP